MATGIAPDGRLYAGDLNGMQDLVPTLSDFTQTLDVGILRVGDPSLQLLKYGPGEFRMSGDLRIDGILRALGGMMSGQFTTAQRDAIAAGRRPFGLIIFNTTTNRYEYNAGSDATPNWQAIGAVTAHASTHLPGGSDPIPFATAVNLSGTRAAKPAASSANAGLLYFETDWKVVWRSTGSAWVRYAHTPRRCNSSEFASLPDFGDADEVFLDNGNGVLWHLVYNSASASPYKWEFIGGNSLYQEIVGGATITTTSYADYGGPTVTLPRAGEYDIEIGMVPTGDMPDLTTLWMSYAVGATPAVDNDSIRDAMESGRFSGANVSRKLRRTISTAVALSARYKKAAASGSTTPVAEQRWISARPIRIG